MRHGEMLLAAAPDKGGCLALRTRLSMCISLRLMNETGNGQPYRLFCRLLVKFRVAVLERMQVLFVLAYASQ